MYYLRVLALSGKLADARCMFPAITTPEESVIMSVKKSKKRKIERQKKSTARNSGPKEISFHTRVLFMR